MKHFSELFNEFFGKHASSAGLWSVVKVPSESREVYAISGPTKACIGLAFNEQDARIMGAAPALLEGCYQALDLIKNELGHGEVTATLLSAIAKARGVS